MHINKQIPLVTTPNLTAQREFYVEHLGFHTTLDLPEYLALVSQDGSVEVGFMPPCPGAKAYQAGGLTLCLEVPDADAEHARLTAAGLQPTRPLTDNPWGDRSFVVDDPAGIAVYIHHPLLQRETPRS